MGYIIWRCFHDPTFSHFTILVCVGRRDGRLERRTNRHSAATYRDIIASRGKNCYEIFGGVASRSWDARTLGPKCTLAASHAAP